MRCALLFVVLSVLLSIARVKAQDSSGKNQPQMGNSLQSGIDFLKEQDKIYERNAWDNRYLSWFCGWFAAALSAFTGVAGKLFPERQRLPIVTGLIAASLISFNQIVKPEVMADGYYRGHILIEGVIGDAAMGRATPTDLSNAWHQAENGLPGGTPSLQK